MVFVTHKGEFGRPTKLRPSIGVDSFRVPIGGKDKEEFVNYGLASRFVFQIECEGPTAELIGDDEPLFVCVLSEIEMYCLKGVEHG